MTCSRCRADCQEPLPRGPYEVCNYDCGGCGDDDESYYPDCVPILGNIGRCTMGIRPPPRPPGAILTLTLTLVVTLATRRRPSGLPFSPDSDKTHRVGVLHMPYEGSFRQAARCGHCIGMQLQVAINRQTDRREETPPQAAVCHRSIHAIHPAGPWSSTAASGCRARATHVSTQAILRSARAGCLPVIDEPVKLGAHCDPSCGCGALLVCNASNACGTALICSSVRRCFEIRALATATYATG